MKSSGAMRVVAMLCLTLCTGAALAQSFPTRPIRVICPGGGGTNLVARLIAQGISEPLGHPVVVDNRPTAVSGPIVMQSPADGYTLLLNGSSFWLAPLLQSRPSYDALRDFAPISLLTTSPSVLVVHPSLPVKSVRELIALMKAKPGQLDYGSNAPGSPSHLAGELLRSLAGVRFVSVPYKGNGPAIAATISGEVQMTIAAAAATASHVQSGRLRALAVASDKRTDLAPGLPTVAETVPGYVARSTYGLLAPAGTPAPVIGRLNEVVVAFLRRPATIDKLKKAGAEVVGGSPEDLRAIIADDLNRTASLLKQAGIRPQ